MIAVIPIPQNASPKTLSNFYAVPLLLIFSKIFEKTIAQKMMNYINKNSILSSSQFEFSTNSSIELAVTSFYDKLLQNMNDQKVI